MKVTINWSDQGQLEGGRPGEFREGCGTHTAKFSVPRYEGVGVFILQSGIGGSWGGQWGAWIHGNFSPAEDRAKVKTQRRYLGKMMLVQASGGQLPCIEEGMWVGLQRHLLWYPPSGSSHPSHPLHTPHTTHNSLPHSLPSLAWPSPHTHVAYNTHIQSTAYIYNPQPTTQLTASTNHKTQSYTIHTHTFPTTKDLIIALFYRCGKWGSQDYKLFTVWPVGTRSQVFSFLLRHIFHAPHEDGCEPPYSAHPGKFMASSVMLLILKMFSFFKMKLCFQSRKPIYISKKE